MFIEKPITRQRKRTKLIYGHGINDADYLTQYKENGKTFKCPYYTKWQSMLGRCFSKKFKIKRPTYKNCTVSKEWLTFSVFKKWMKAQEWISKQLDKDILVWGNKHYSSETCIFVTQEINKLLTFHQLNKGKYPIGVSIHENLYQSQLKKYGKIYSLGYFTTPEEAHEAWLNAKSQHILEVGNNQEQPLKDALIKIANNLTGYIESLSK